MGSRPAHVAVIDPAVHTPELDCFNRMAACAPVPLTYHLPALQGMASVRDDEPGTLGIVILGSASSVHDRLPWQLELADRVRAAMERRVPVLGICFGHQLIAHLLGARVEFLYEDHRKLEAFQTATIAPLWGAGQQTGPLYASHREVVTTCPQDMTEVVSRPGVPFDGLAHRERPVWTFQTHPEATPAFLAARNIASPDPAQFALGHSLVDAFVRFAAERRA